MESKHKFEIIYPANTFYPHYVFRGKVISEKQFNKLTFEELMIGDRSTVHVCEMTPAEIIERFGDTLTAEQIEYLKEHEQKAKEYAKR